MREHAKEQESTLEFLAKLANDPRITVRRSGLPLKEGKSVVYWIQRAMRGIDNPARGVQTLDPELVLQKV